MLSIPDYVLDLYNVGILSQLYERFYLLTSSRHCLLYLFDLSEVRRNLNNFQSKLMNLSIDYFFKKAGINLTIRAWAEIPLLVFRIMVGKYFLKASFLRFNRSNLLIALRSLNFNELLLILLLLVRMKAFPDYLLSVHSKKSELFNIY